MEKISSSVDKKPLHVVKFTPYRGVIEPITVVHCALINLYANLIEVVLHYEFVKVADRLKSDGYVRFAEMFTKGMFSISIGTVSHDEGEDEERVHVVFISAAVPNQVMLRCKDEDEAESVYKAIKKWMIV